MSKLSPTRRRFMQNTSAIVGAGAVTPIALGSPKVHNSVDDRLKIGLIGCGGRGTGAAINALNADENSEVVALCDIFPDRIDQCHDVLLKSKHADRIKVDEERKYSDFDGYKKLIDSDIDVVLLCATPHFRPRHIEYAIEKGKHVFCEKPVAVDPPGVRKVRAACELAKQKSLNVVSGLCWRYDVAVNETMKRIKDGEIGEIRSIQENYLTGTLWHRGNNPEWSQMEYQIRNWLYFTWLSGDLTAEQHIHSLDKAMWLMDDKPPKTCYGMGGRLVRTGEKWGNVYDHFACCYEWENGVKTHSMARQMAGCFNNVDDYVYGTEGSAQILRFIVDGKSEKWRFRGRKPSMYDVEHVELFKSIRNGETINNGNYMCNSTLLAIMGRQACYSGQEIEWDELAAADWTLGPDKYEWGDVDGGKVAMPGAV